MNITCQIVCTSDVIWQGPLIAVPHLDEEIEIEDGSGVARYMIVSISHSLGRQDEPNQTVLITVLPVPEKAVVDGNIVPLRSSGDVP